MSQLPPHSLEVERSTLSVILIEPKAIDLVSDTLKVEHFYSEGHRRIYETCLALNANNEPIDTTTVINGLKGQNRLEQVGGITYVIELLGEAPNLRNIEAYAKTLVEKWRLREAIALGHSLAAEGYTTDEPEKFIQKFESKVNALSNTQNHSRLTSLGKALQTTYLNYDRLRKNGVTPGMRTGFRAVDRITGGLHKGDLTVIAARPGMGKTAFAVQIATFIQNAVIFSLEMQAEQLVTRMICGESGVSVPKMRNGLTSPDEDSRIIHGCYRLGETLGRSFWIDDTPGPNILDIRARTRRASSAAKVDLVVVDYIQLMSSAGGARSREQEISEFTRGLKAMAKELDVAVVALSQLNRDVEKRQDKRPMLSDLRESGAIEQDADNVVFLYRDGYYTKERLDDSCEAIWAKQRNGPIDTAMLRFVGEHTRFHDKADDTEQQAYR